MRLPPIISCFIEVHVGLTFLVPAYPGCPGKRLLDECCCALLVSLCSAFVDVYTLTVLTVITVVPCVRLDDDDNICKKNLSV